MRLPGNSTVFSSKVSTRLIQKLYWQKGMGRQSQFGIGDVVFESSWPTLKYDDTLESRISANSGMKVPLLLIRSYLLILAYLKENPKKNKCNPTVIPDSREHSQQKKMVYYIHSKVLVSYSKPPLAHKRLIFVNVKDWNVNVRVGTKGRWSKWPKTWQRSFWMTPSASLNYLLAQEPSTGGLNWYQLIKVWMR